jgi:hypothetical protein
MTADDRSGRRVIDRFGRTVTVDRSARRRLRVVRTDQRRRGSRTGQLRLDELRSTHRRRIELASRAPRSSAVRTAAAAAPEVVLFFGGAHRGDHYLVHVLRRVAVFRLEPQVARANDRTASQLQDEVVGRVTTATDPDEREFQKVEFVGRPATVRLACRIVAAGRNRHRGIGQCRRTAAAAAGHRRSAVAHRIAMLFRRRRLLRAGAISSTCDVGLQAVAGQRLGSVRTVCRARCHVRGAAHATRRRLHFVHVNGTPCQTDVVGAGQVAGRTKTFFRYQDVPHVFCATAAKSDNFWLFFLCAKKSQLTKHDHDGDDGDDSDDGEEARGGEVVMVADEEVMLEKSRQIATKKCNQANEIPN